VAPNYGTGKRKTGKHGTREYENGLVMESQSSSTANTLTGVNLRGLTAAKSGSKTA